MDDATKSHTTSLLEPQGGIRRQQRSLATRRELIDAARIIFARDGFELTRLEDIAAAAGKTRGAFYANFKDKEDVFFAIVEDDIAHDSEILQLRLSAVGELEERLEVLSRHLLWLLEDRPRMLLSLEFKLYAIRRPLRQKRLADLYAEMCMRCAETHIDHLLPELRHTDPERKRGQAAIFGAALDGLMLNRLFQPTTLWEDEMLTLIRAAVRIALARVRDA